MTESSNVTEQIIDSQFFDMESTILYAPLLDSNKDWAVERRVKETAEALVEDAELWTRTVRIRENQKYVTIRVSMTVEISEKKVAKS